MSDTQILLVTAIAASASAAVAALGVWIQARAAAQQARLTLLSKRLQVMEATTRAVAESLLAVRSAINVGSPERRKYDLDVLRHASMELGVAMDLAVALFEERFLDHFLRPVHQTVEQAHRQSARAWSSDAQGVLPILEDQLVGYQNELPGAFLPYVSRDRLAGISAEGPGTDRALQKQAAYVPGSSG